MINHKFHITLVLQLALKELLRCPSNYINIGFITVSSYVIVVLLYFTIAVGSDGDISQLILPLGILYLFISLLWGLIVKILAYEKHYKLAQEYNDYLNVGFTALEINSIFTCQCIIINSIVLVLMIPITEFINIGITQYFNAYDHALTWINQLNINESIYDFKTNSSPVVLFLNYLILLIMTLVLSICKNSQINSNYKTKSFGLFSENSIDKYWILFIYRNHSYINEMKLTICMLYLIPVIFGVATFGFRDVHMLNDVTIESKGTMPVIDHALVEEIISIDGIESYSLSPVLNNAFGDNTNEKYYYLCINLNEDMMQEVIVNIDAYKNIDEITIVYHCVTEKIINIRYAFTRIALNMISFLSYCIATFGSYFILRNMGRQRIEEFSILSYIGMLKKQLIETCAKSIDRVMFGACMIASFIGSCIYIVIDMYGGATFEIMNVLTCVFILILSKIQSIVFSYFIAHRIMKMIF